MEISDEQLWDLCREYGQATLMWRRKFIGLLPEVSRRHLYEKKGFSSIFEFAAKLAGISAEQVRLTLNLERRFKDKPRLQEALIEGEVSLNKLARIASIATPENERSLAHQIQMLPQRTIETLVRDEKQNGSNKAKNDHDGLRAQTLNFELSPKIIEQLNALHSKGHNMNELLARLLEEREEKIEIQKDEIASGLQQTHSRYLPISVKKILHEEYGTKCSIRTCTRPAEAVHHTQRFSMSKLHDPHYLTPLCREHHQIAHSIDIKVQEFKKTATMSPVHSP